MAQEFTVGSVSVRALEEHEGCPLYVVINKPSAEVKFDFQAKDRFLNLSEGELGDLLQAGEALRQSLKKDDRDLTKWMGDKVERVTRASLMQTAASFHWAKKMPKWTVIVEGRELPARPVLLDAAGVPPNDPTNSHRAVAKLKGLGFDVRYEGKSV